MKKYCFAALRSLLIVAAAAVCGAALSPAPATTRPAAASPRITRPTAATPPAPATHHYLYVAAPGVRNYLQYGGHGLLVFDMDNHFKFVKRIATGGLDDKGQPSNVKGVAVSLYTHCIYISTIQSLLCLDLQTEKLVWEKKYENGCDRMSVSPDGKTIYLPSFEGDDWKVLDARTGDVLHKVVTHSGSHNTIYGPDGQKVYLEGLRSNYLTVVRTSDYSVSQAGPFFNHIRPFTIDSRQQRCYVNCDSLLGFEVGDLHTGRMITHVDVKGFQPGPVKRHGCPSHGIALTPDEREVWLADAFNESIHIFTLTDTNIRQGETIRLRDQPGWITFSIDGKYALPSTGDIIDTKTKKIVATLKDETGAPVQSEKMVEIGFAGQRPVQAGDQFGIGRRGSFLK